MIKEPMEEQEDNLSWMKIDAMSEKEKIKFIIETYKKADKHGRAWLLVSAQTVIGIQQDKIKKREQFKTIK